MHSASRCARLIFTWCPRQDWKLHPRTTRGGGRHSVGSSYRAHPHSSPTGANLTPSHVPTHIPAAFGKVLHPAGAHHPSPITWDHRTPTGPSRPCFRAGREPGKQLLQPLPLLLSQPPAHDLFNPNLSSHKYTSSWQETCFSYTSPLLLRETFPAARAPCASPQLFLPAPLRYFRHATKSAAAQRP